MKKIVRCIVALLFVIVAAVGGNRLFSIMKTPEVKKYISTYKQPEPVKNFDEEYDVIVIGGEPEGVAAAVSAARNGAKTLLVEDREELGGLFTYGMLNFIDVPQGEDGEPVSQGIYEQWNRFIGRQNSFGILEAKVAFKKLVDDEPNITLSAETKVVESILDHNRVAAVKLKNEYGEFEVKGHSFIDATQDADFAAMSHVPYFTGGEDIGIKDKKMAVTLMIHLKNVDWKQIKKTAKSEKFGPAEVTNTVAWGFTNLHYDYKPVEENTRLRGLNLVKIDDDYYINALQIFGVDGLDDQSKQDAIKKGEIETRHILTFLQKEFPGFEKAEIVSYPTELYVRETRHIMAEYQLPMSDVWTNKDHWDVIGWGAYPVDVQAQSPHDYGYVLSKPEQYAIPFRSLVPLKIDGLLVVGRSAGFSSLAAGSARIVPTGMATGEAAGAAAALALKEHISFREMSKNKALIRTLRDRLNQQGAYVDHHKTDYPYKGEWFDPSIQTLMNYGLAVAGYENDLMVDELVTRHRFMNMIYNSIQRVNPEIINKLGNKFSTVYSEVIYSKNGPLKRDEAATILAKIFFEDTGKNNWEMLKEKGIIDKDLAGKLSKNKKLKVKELFAITDAVITYIEQE
ncbi:FAD-dependent oxidoreductase [Peribacillus loiseleuriae]|uniref:FAD-dependent oxidoreductase n=1 Tax=Peribacillus loiseleuriae TaxID=1679170 RepID=UPI0037FA17FE